jgi:methionine-rich copper-binding protein CopC
MAVTSRRLWRALVTASIAGPLILGLAAGAVAAHSEFVSVTPADGSSVTWPAGTSIVLTFSEALKSGSRADITGPGNAKVGTATVDPANNTHLTFTPPTPLGPGAYSITWTSIATDGDILRSKAPLTFTVTAAVATDSGSSSPSLTPTQAPSTAPTPDPAAAGGTGADALLPVVAAIVVIGVLGAILLRNRRSSARR